MDDTAVGLAALNSMCFDHRAVHVFSSHLPAMFSLLLLAQLTVALLERARQQLQD